MSIRNAIRLLIGVTITAVGIAVAAFIGGYFNGMGGSAWRVSEQALPRLSSIITGSIAENENSSITPRRPVKKPPDDDDKPLFERWFGKQ